MKKLVAYYRVSTKKQGQSKLGLQAQKAAVAEYAERTGAKIVAEVTEVESGKRNDRPKLRAALNKCRLTKATLVVAKLDRLARNVAFTSALMESEVDFVCCDMPQMNRFTVHILAAVAEQEAAAIADRTRAGLARAKANGKLLGSARPGHWDGKERGWKKAAETAAQLHTERALVRNRPLYDEMMELRAEGKTFVEIAEIFNNRGYTTQHGKPFDRKNLNKIRRQYDHCV